MSKHGPLSWEGGIRSQATLTSSSRNEDLRRAREQREEERRLSKHVSILQRSISGRSAKQRVMTALRQEFDKRISDIIKLKTLLAATAATNGKSKAFTPVSLTILLTRQLVFFYQSSIQEDVQRLGLLCSTLINERLQSEKEARNMALSAFIKGKGYPFWFVKMIKMMIASLQDLNHHSDQDYSSSSIVSSLRLLIALPGDAGQALHALVIPLYMPILRSICLSKDPTFADPSKIKGGLISSTSALPDLTPLFEIAVQLLRMTLEQGRLEISSLCCQEYTANLLTLPLYAMKSEGLVDHSACLRSLAGSWHSASSSASLPESPNSTASSHTWLLSNACYFINSVVVIRKMQIDSAVLVEALQSLCALLELAPVSIFSDRGAISFETQGSHIKTLVITPVVVNHIQLIMKESFIRLITRSLLKGVDESVLKRAGRAEDNKDVSQALNTSALELTEASHRDHRIEQDKWAISRWADNAMKSLGDLFSGGSRNKDMVEGQDAGMADEEDMEREQEGGGEGWDPLTVDTLSRLLTILLWKSHGSACVGVLYGSPSMNPITQTILFTLAFSTPMVPHLCAHVLTHYTAEMKDDSSLRRIPIIQEGLMANLVVLAAAYAHLSMLLGEDMYAGVPFPLPLVVRLIKTFKVLCYTLCLTQAQGGQQGVANCGYGPFCLSVFARLLRTLFETWSRKAFCAVNVWLIADTETRRLRREIQQQTPLGSLLLKSMPFCISFSERMRVFETWLAMERAAFQPQNERGTIVKIRRGYLLEDGFALLDKLGGRLKRKVVIVYISNPGAQEMGIDAGGLLKEFIVDLAAIIFDNNYGLFATTSQGHLYPSPGSRILHGEDHEQLYEFVGRILGKAIFEGVTLGPIFTHFFLGFLRGNYNSMDMISDLATFDLELYKNLMFLKTYQGNAEDLGLSFTMVNDDFGRQQEIELVKGGTNIPVTNANKFRYINLVAKHHIYDRIRVQATACVRGFHEVISPSMLRIFSPAELQIIISGNISGAIDLHDLKRHTLYSGGYTSVDRHVQRFWKILYSFTPAEQAAFLRFVTSCPRPPSLGFAALHPPFTIQRVSTNTDDVLPSASTCFNRLNLPTYRSVHMAREKLRYAIYNARGFELS